MILLADSGSTKTDWCLVDHGKVVATVKTAGTNPFFQTTEEIANELATNLLKKCTFMERVAPKKRVPSWLMHYTNNSPLLVFAKWQQTCWLLHVAYVAIIQALLAS